jgi:hypothetical protein
VKQRSNVIPGRALRDTKIGFAPFVQRDLSYLKGQIDIFLKQYCAYYKVSTP